MFRRLDRIPACDRRTNRQTDILSQHSPCYAYASRGKNEGVYPTSRAGHTTSTLLSRRLHDAHVRCRRLTDIKHALNVEAILAECPPHPNATPLTSSRTRICLLGTRVYSAEL